MTNITKVVALMKQGSLVIYYCGDRQVASESYDRNGLPIYRSGSIPDGVVRQYYGNGTVKEETTFRDGKAHGKSIEYYPRGEAFEESTYKSGMRDGPTKIYLREGLPWIEASYKNGKLHGIFLSYHDNGRIEARVRYRNGKPDGCYVAYDRHGNFMGKGSSGPEEDNHKPHHEAVRVETKTCQ